MSLQDEPQLIELRLNNSPAALPRLLLAFSRRRLLVSELVMLDDESGRPATIRMGFRLDSSRMESFLRQIERMLDIESVEWVGQPVSIAPVAA